MPPERCMDPVRLRGISYKRFQSAGVRSFQRKIAANQGKGRLGRGKTYGVSNAIIFWTKVHFIQQ